MSHHVGGWAFHQKWLTVCGQVWLGNITGQIPHSSYVIFLFLEKDSMEFYGTFFRKRQNVMVGKCGILIFLIKS
jgi:hypothetical protein